MSMRIRQWLLSLLVFAAGLSVSVAVGDFVSTRWSEHPSVHDLALEQLPYVNLFFIGEMAYWFILAVYLLLYIWKDKAKIPYVLLVVGMYYVLRSVFLLLLPLGHPFDAPVYDERWSLYPQYAYFPGGHVGFLTILTLGLPRVRGRAWFWLVVALFGLGTMLTRAHYTADVLGAIVIAYAVYAFAERYIRARWVNALSEK